MSEKLKENLDKDEFKIIDIETIEKGNVKLKSFKLFVKSCTYKFTVLSILSYVLLHAINAGNSVWLSDWTDNAEYENDDSDKKLMRISVLFGIGALASNCFYHTQYVLELSCMELGTGL